MKKLVNLGANVAPIAERNVQTSAKSGISSAIDGIRGFFVKDDGEHRLIIATSYGTGANKRTQTAFTSCDNMEFIEKLKEVAEQKGLYFSLQGEPAEYGNLTNEEGELVELPASLTDGYVINEVKMQANCRFTVIAQYSLDFDPDYDGEETAEGLCDVETLDFSWKKGVPFCQDMDNNIYLFFVQSRAVNSIEAKTNKIGNRSDLIKALNAEIGEIVFKHDKTDYLAPEDAIEVLNTVYNATSTTILEGVKDGKFGAQGTENAALNNAMQQNTVSLPQINVSTATIATIGGLVKPYKDANRLDLLQGTENLKPAVKAAYNKAIK